MKSISDMTQEEVNRYCRAASAAYYAIVSAHARRTGEGAMLPTHLCPKNAPPYTCEFSDEELEEAEQFLLRLGVIGQR